MQALEVAAALFGLGHHEKTSARRINYRSPGDSDLVLDVAGLLSVRWRNRRHASAKKALFPILYAGLSVGVEGVDAVVLGGDEDDVVRAAGDREIRHIERLGVDFAIHGAGEEFSERSAVYRT